MAVEAAEARPKRAAQGAAGAVVPGGDDDGMRAREGWARMELSKLCLTEVAPDYVRCFGSVSCSCGLLIRCNVRRERRWGNRGTGVCWCLLFEALVRSRVGGLPCDRGDTGVQMHYC